MPLRQSLLNFRPSAGSGLPATVDDESPRRQSAVRGGSSTSSEVGDTIVIPMTVGPRQQLPTPSETSTDLSSQSADYFRTVSGETLVNDPSVSQISLAKPGVEALDLAWSASEPDLHKDADTRTLSAHTILVSADYEEEQGAEDAEAETERLARTAARRARVEEKQRLREEKYKAADGKATRRSSRASMLSKASDVVGGLAATVLGKRKSRVDELKGDQQRGRTVGAASAANQDLPTPDAKRRRRSYSDQTSVAQAAQSIKARRAKDKKWLASGLYAGQSSTSTKSPLTASPRVRENTVLPLPMFAGERLLQTGRDFKLPFDVFSPLPPGQPKPDEWRKSNRNTFVGDAQAEWRTSKFIEHSTCMCKAEAGCGDDCMNRFMYYECDERNCNLAPDQCGNRAFADLSRRKKKGNKYNIGVEVIKTADRGYGVRSNRTFEPNQIIVEYSGEILTQEECEMRMRKEYKDNTCYYLMNFDQNMVIDATTKGSIARFVNHSCAPNCRMEKWTVGGQPRMALFAGQRGVMTGEELTYDYNFDPYSRKNVQECRCGEDNCRGVLGPKQQKPVKKDDAVVDEKPPKAKAGAGNSIKQRVLNAVQGRRRRPRLNNAKPGQQGQKARAVVYERKISTGSGIARANKLRTQSRKLAPPAAAASLSRRPSHKRTGGRTSAARIVSSNSGSTTLLEKEEQSNPKPQVRRSTSLKDRVKSMTRTMNKRVRSG
ncbi:hypothetical protein DV737_g3916, partial [Chaetothyriales sp. CBS 132003]